MKKIYSKAITLMFSLIMLSTAFTSCKEQKKKVVKVGLLHSFTGTMSGRIDRKSLSDLSFSFARSAVLA